MRSWLVLFSCALMMMCPALVMAQQVPDQQMEIPQDPEGKPDWVADDQEDQPDEEDEGQGGKPAWVTEDREGKPDWVDGHKGKPDWVADHVAAKKQHYKELIVSTDEDPFVDPERFSEVTNGIPFIDENGDSIADIVQNTEFFLKLGEFIDENQDSIHDPFQTWEMYQALGLKNFVDVDGDGICDNYVKGIAHRENGKIRYENIDIDLSEDPFINPERFAQLSGGIPFVDEDGNGIGDIFQDTELFRSFNFGDFIDENGDGIHDPFQAWEMYHALGLRNFVDVDGDGICDNYLENTDPQ